MLSAMASTPIHSDRDIGQQVLKTESNALEMLADALDESFDQALKILRSTEGRVVVSGVGKSGHIGRKIAATLASTGCPSFFLHAAEAGHGDLGMVASGDTLFLISYSGETQELSVFIDHARRLSLPIISITGQRDSSLSRVSTLALILPEFQEACPMGLAPTTSTTAMLALGDAIAVALFQGRGFTKKDFHLLHPKGQLGAKLRCLSDVMHQGEKLPLVLQTSMMEVALLEMTLKGFGCVGVVDDGGFLKGVITDGDLRRHMSPHLLAQSVESIMTIGPAVLTATDFVMDAVSLMEEKSITNAFVVSEEGVVEGIVHIHDCLRRML